MPAEGVGTSVVASTPQLAPPSPRPRSCRRYTSRAADTSAPLTDALCKRYSSLRTIKGRVTPPLRRSTHQRLIKSHYIIPLTHDPHDQRDLGTSPSLTRACIPYYEHRDWREEIQEPPAAGRRAVRGLNQDKPPVSFSRTPLDRGARHRINFIAGPWDPPVLRTPTIQYANKNERAKYQMMSSINNAV